VEGNTGLRPRFLWRTSRFAVPLDAPRIMGIVNVTPDSFSDGDPGMTPARALATCERLVREGAHILDLGGESSRPGAEPVPLDVELARVLPVLKGAVTLGVPVSIDSAKPEVMRAALDLGADIVNDIGALRVPGALEAVAAHPSCGVVLMHMRGVPRSMQAGEPTYGDVVAEVRDFLAARAAAAEAGGVARERIVVDAGIGFGKTPAHNLALLARQRELVDALPPLLAGWSRKSTVVKLAGLAGIPRGQRTAEQQATVDAASVAAAVLAVERGAAVVRVHAVAQTAAALALVAAARATPSPRE
jgi:dihydropteroate synthase